MKSLLLSCSAVLAFLPNVSFAQEALSDFTITGDATLVSDYVFRGISQSDENIALQAGLDVSHISGMHASLWASSVDFNDNDEASIEVDAIAGYAGEFHSFSYDIGGIYYAYPGADSNLNYDFYEAYVSLGYEYDFISANVGVNYSPEYFADSGDATYLSLSADAALPHNFNFGGAFGYQYIDDNASFGVPDYADWS